MLSGLVHFRSSEALSFAHLTIENAALPHWQLNGMYIQERGTLT